jgi:hypothetical protein
MLNIDKYTDKINDLLNNFTDNTYISSFLILFFITYGGFLGTGGQPPQVVIQLFKNPFFRILLLTLLAYMANKNIQVSLAIALVFYLTQQYIFKQESFEQIKSLEKFQNIFYINKIKEEVDKQAKIN